ncbi:MAG: peptide/nickel transport system permease protein [Candidatus Azotimanducaceae bacterium]
MTASVIIPASASPASLLRLWKRHPNFVIGVLMLSTALLAAIAAPWLGTIDPQTIAPFNRLEAPGANFWFGGDLVGRDVYSRTVYGSQISLAVGLGVTIIGVSLGLVVGILSGFVNWIDQILMRVMDGLMAIPSILLAVALISLAGASLKNVIIAISIAEIPRVARLVRSVVLQLKERPYVEAAITAGTPFILVLWRHILPNTLAPLLVQATYIFASAVLTEAILSFIGAGTPPSTPSWGNIIAEGRTVFSIAPHIVMFPGIALSFTVLGVNLMGDGLRDIFDPRYVSRT